MADVLWQDRYGTYFTYHVSTRQGSSGGQGSFSYADTSVYGARQPRFFPIYEYYRYDTATGLILSTTRMTGSDPIGAGGGGGARVNQLKGYGSKAPGYSPHGLVLIRLFRVD
jgi:hypothetical protein